MQETLLPLFPLEAVLLPSNILPLHIFEERYKEMIGEAIRNKTEFGVVQAGEKGILNLGCTAIVEKVVTEYPDGRMDILSRRSPPFRDSVPGSGEVIPSRGSELL